MFNFKNLSSASSINFSGAFGRTAELLALFIIAASAIWPAVIKAQSSSSSQPQTSEQPATIVENPLLRSGLALAGANVHKG